MTPEPTGVDGRVDLLLTAFTTLGGSPHAPPPTLVRKDVLPETATQPKPCATPPANGPARL